MFIRYETTIFLYLPKKQIKIEVDREKEEMGNEKRRAHQKNWQKKHGHTQRVFGSSSPQLVLSDANSRGRMKDMDLGPWDKLQEGNDQEAATLSISQTHAIIMAAAAASSQSNARKSFSPVESKQSLGQNSEGRSKFQKAKSKINK